MSLPYADVKTAIDVWHTRCYPFRIGSSRNFAWQELTTDVETLALTIARPLEEEILSTALRSN